MLLVSKAEQVCYFLYLKFLLISCIFFLILGPPGPSGADGLPGGKLIMKTMGITVLFSFFFIL